MKKKILIDIGAHKGLYCLKWKNNPHYKIYAFEANPELHNAFLAPAASDNFKPILKAASNYDGKAKFNINNEPGTSSLKSFTSVKDTWPFKGPNNVLETVKIVEVDVTKMSTFLLEEHLENSSIDFVKIDAQGSDLDVLKSFDEMIRNVKAFTIEVSLTPKSQDLYENEHKDFEVIEFAKQNGFVLQKQSIGPKNLWADFLFVSCTATDDDKKFVSSIAPR